ncbi:TniQ family protein [Erythrobacter sp. KY5]|uniref:TniQ family protein n=1 Tax=Erythrobacter sp. KY5 TaxID=2011159 RepID=UPI0013A6B928|nr:TniQ family protein [Erythrobacter sp. KY5]
MSRWHIRPRPLPRESITSWLIRIAEAKGTKHHSLMKELVPGLEFWTRDSDLVAPPELIEALAVKTGVPLERARCTALSAYEGVLAECISGANQSFMVVPLGVRHRIRKAHGQAFCPQCLAEETAYLPLTWRLRLFPTCTRHGTILMDACLDCGAPYQPHRGGMRLCDRCALDLTTLEARTADPNVLTLQAHNELVLDGCAVAWPYLNGTHPIAFFAMELALFRAIVSRGWGSRVRDALQPSIGTLEFEYRAKTPSIRAMTTISAHNAMRGVERLLRGWPFGLVGLCGEARAWASWIVPEETGVQTPFALRDALDTYLRPGSSNAR